jgi:hypothetical protein
VGFVKSIGEAVAAVIRRQRGRGAKQGVLQVAGFGLLSYAAGMWILPVGVAVAGVSLLLLAWLVE